MLACKSIASEIKFSSTFDKEIKNTLKEINQHIVLASDTRKEIWLTLWSINQHSYWGNIRTEDMFLQFPKSMPQNQLNKNMISDIQEFTEIIKKSRKIKKAYFNFIELIKKEKFEKLSQDLNFTLFQLKPMNGNLELRLYAPEIIVSQNSASDFPPKINVEWLSKLEYTLQKYFVENNASFLIRMIQVDLDKQQLVFVIKPGNDDPADAK